MYDVFYCVDKYLVYILFYLGLMDWDFEKFFIQNENGFVWDDINF